MFDSIRFFLKILRYHRISKQPRAVRLQAAQQNAERLRQLLPTIDCYRDRLLPSGNALNAYPAMNKATYHQWKLAGRLAGPQPQQFADHIQAALAEHAKNCDLGSQTPIRPFTYQGNSYLAYSTSGSSGRTIELVKSISYLEELVALQMARGSAERKTVPNAIRKWWKPLGWSVLLRGPGAFPGISLLSNQPPITRKLVNQQVFDIASLPWEQVKAKIVAMQPQILTTYPSTLVRIAQEGWPLKQLKLAVAMSEPFTETMKRSVREAFPNTIVTDHYATGECPILTTACPAGHGAHINDDVALCQPLRKDGTPCEPGEVSSQVLITDLLNTVQPFVNYIIEDQILLDQNLEDRACECGSRTPTILRVEGRNSDKIALPSGFVIDNVMLRGLVTRYPSIIDYQLVYSEAQPRIRLNLVVEKERQGAVETSKRIADKLRDMTPDKIACQAEVVTSLPIDQNTGKARRFVVSNN